MATAKTSDAVATSWDACLVVDSALRSWCIALQRRDEMTEKEQLFECGPVACGKPESQQSIHWDHWGRTAVRSRARTLR